MGIRLATDRGADCILLLNNDTTVDEGLLSKLVRATERDVRNGFADLRFASATMPDGRDVISFAGGSMITKACNIGDRDEDIGQYDNIAKVSYTQGACLLVRREVVQQIGLLDPTLFAY